VSGARMHATYYRPGGVYRDLPEQMSKYRESPWHKGGDLKRLNAWRMLHVAAKQVPQSHGRAVTQPAAGLSLTKSDQGQTIRTGRIQDKVIDGWLAAARNHAGSACGLVLYLP